MSNTILLRQGTVPWFKLILFSLFASGLAIYYQTKMVKQATDPLIAEIVQKIGIQAPKAILRKAIRLAAKNLAEELGIDLENYDLTLEEYEALVQAAMEKFGSCEQYRLMARTSGTFPCYSCTTKSNILLQINQTFKIGQTCLEEKGRYSKALQLSNLLYQKEFEGSIFEVLVAEYVKLLLFRSGVERKNIMKINSLVETELLLPPGNKILR